MFQATRKRERLAIRRAERINMALSLMELAEQSTFTTNHSRRVSKVSRKIAECLRFPEDQADVMARAAIFHDIGKLGIPQALLFKKGNLSETELGVIQGHPLIGAAVLRKLDMKMEATIVEQHHELLDGSGYPYGLRNKQILRHARIINVADVFDALVVDRPYRGGAELASAMSYLYRWANVKFDGNIVHALYEVADSDEIRDIYQKVMVKAA